MVLTVEVNELGRLHRSHERDALHLLMELRKQRLRHVQVIGHLRHIEILWRPARLLEVPAIHLANRATELDQDAVAGAAAWVRGACGVHVEWPDEAINPSPREGDAAPLQDVTSCG